MNANPTKLKIISYASVGNALLAIAIITGIFVRFKGIGRWPLTDDEFYMAQSIKFILKNWVPAFESGGYYLRGLLYQYFAASFLSIFSNSEFWLRAIPAAFNLLSVPALFWLGKRIGGKAVAYVVVVLFMLSIWEIEFSRFARMYTFFQTIFLWYLVALYKVCIDDDRNYEKWMYILAAAAPLVYEGAIFLSLLNFIPIVYSKRLKLNSTRFLYPIIILVGTYLFLSTDFRRLGAVDYLPDNLIMNGKEGDIALPTLMIPILFTSPAWTALFGLTILINGFLGYRILSSNSENLSKPAFVLIILLAQLHMFGLMLGYAVVLISLFYYRLNIDWQRIKYPLLISIIVSFSFWILFAFSAHWHQLFPGIEYPSFKKYILLLFNYPDVYTRVIYQWLKVMPWLSVFLGLVTAVTFVKLAIDSQNKNIDFFFLIAIVAMMVLIVGVLRTTYNSTRYTFFLYPLALLISVTSISTLTRMVVRNEKRYGLIFAIVVVVYMGISEDYKLKHLYKIDSPEINFRIGIDRDSANHYYHRLDYRTPAEMINAEIITDEIVVTIFTPAAYYLQRTDYVYLDDYNHLIAQSSSNGKKEIWTNANLISQQQQLWDLIQTSATPVWVIAGSEKIDRNSSVKAISAAIMGRYSQFIVGRSIDEKLSVYHILPNRIDPVAKP